MTAARGVGVAVVTVGGLAVWLLTVVDAAAAAAREIRLENQQARVRERRAGVFHVVTGGAT